MPSRVCAAAGIVFLTLPDDSCTPGRVDEQDSERTNRFFNSFGRCRIPGDIFFSVRQRRFAGLPLIADRPQFNESWSRNSKSISINAAGLCARMADESRIVKGLNICLRLTSGIQALTATSMARTAAIRL